MSIQDDWLLQQIQQTINLVIDLVNGTNSEVSITSTGLTSSDGTKLLEQQLSALTSEYKLSEAEDLLFEKIDRDNNEHLGVGLNFYNQLNTLTDKQLDGSGFPRPEILDGLHDLLDIYGLTLPIE